MFRQCICFILLSVICFQVDAQKGSLTLRVNGEAALPSFQSDPGFGLSATGLYGVGKSAQLTLSGGFTIFYSKSSAKNKICITRLVPVLLGYKQIFRRFFIEPRLGIGELGGKVTTDGDVARPSITAMFGGLGAGYTLKRIILGVTYTSAKGISGSDAGLWHNRNINYAGVSIGYNILAGRSR